jgi:dihydroorotate dehydrogenase
MTTLEFLRQFKLSGYAIFDLVATFVGMGLLSPFLTKAFAKIGVKIPKLNWLILALPIGIVAHLMVGKMTPMTENFLDPNKHYTLKIFLVGLAVLGLKDTELAIKIRNKFLAFFYQKICKPIFFKIDPETIHDHMITMGKFLGSNPITRAVTRLSFDYDNPILEQKILGMHFKNPMGIAAGFDKNAELTQLAPSLGLGFHEVGSITGEPCEGNPKPRVWRLPKEKSLRINYGLKNQGCEEISKRLSHQKFKIPIGINIAKTNCALTANDDAAIQDYAKAFRAFATIGDYFTINISCPNAHGGQPFTDPKKLDSLLAQLKKIPTKKPLLLKLSPDLSDLELDALLDVAIRHEIDGFLCTNLTKQHQLGEGGLSGKAVEALSNAMISKVRKKTEGKKLIIGCGGIFSAEDAYAKIRAGASLIQLITGMIFQGPQLISEINQGLVKYLKRDGFKSIAEAIGAKSP